jgi:hypothetical protein
LIIIYYCQTGKYAALAAAGLHLKVLNTSMKLKELVTFFKSYEQPIFLPIYIGEDSEGRKIYALGTAMEKKLTAKIIDSFQQTFYAGKEAVATIDVLPQLSFFVLLLVRLLPLRYFNWLGDRIIAFAIWQNLQVIQKQIRNQLLSLTSGSE